MRPALLLALASLPVAAQPARTAALAYDARDPYARPMVHADVGGREVELLVDTGSTVSAVSRHLARELRLAGGEARRVGSDYAGRPVVGHAAPAVADVAGFGAVDGYVLDDDWIDPARGADPDVDGLLSPIALAATEGTLVVDLDGGTLAAATWPEAYARVGRMPVELADLSTLEDGKLVVLARVDGKPRRLALDTGAPRTLLYRRDERAVPAGTSVAGGHDARVRIGALDATLTVDDLQPVDGPPPPYDGLLGMDVLRGCVIALDARHFVVRCRAGRTASATRGPDVEHARYLATSRKGPKLRMRANGSLEWYGRGLHAIVARDGTVTLEHYDAGELPQRRLDDDRTDERWFLDETFEARAALARDQERRDAESSLDGLAALLDGIWRDRRFSARVRRRALLALWDDCIEPDDPSLGWAGRRARRIIDRWVRDRLPDGSADAFTKGELARFNAARARPPYFAPYDGRSDDTDEADLTAARR